MENSNQYRLVVYTDGAAKPSRGNWGSGYFGYIYDINNIDKVTKSLPKNIIPTTHGFISPELIQEDPKFYKEAKDVQIEDYVIGSLPGHNIQTNNYAEINAFHSFLCKLKSIKKNIVHVLVFMDSQMLITVIKELITNPSPNFDKYAYPFLYSSIHGHIRELMDKGIKIVVKHTYGHRFSIGNNIADRLAFMARLACEEVTKTQDMSKFYSYSEVIPVTPDKDTFWNKFELKPYIVGKNLYHTSSHAKGETPYYVLEYPSETEVGEKNGEILMGSIYTNKGDDVIEKVISTHLTHRPDDGIVFSIELQNLKSPFTYFYNQVSENYSLSKENNLGILKSVEERIICRTLRPGSLALKLLNKFEIHPFILEAFLENKNNEQIMVVDVTDQFFKLKPQKNGTSKTECILNIKTTSITLDFKGLSFPFSLKTDIPNRNYLKKYELATNVRCGMVFREITPICYDYYFVLQGTFPDNEQIYSIWNNYYSSKIYLTKNKEQD